MINHINLLDGLNLNPIPLDFSQQISTTKWLGAIESKVNSVIDIVNNMENDNNIYTDEQIAKIQKEIDELNRMLLSGEYIKDGSIKVEKLDPSFYKDLQSVVVNYVHEATKFVTFGLKGDYFVAYMPYSWKDLDFGTTENGELTITM